LTPLEERKQAEAEVLGPWEERQAHSRETQRRTDRMFDSILARFGWVRNQSGQLEHIGLAS